MASKRKLPKAVSSYISDEELYKKYLHGAKDDELLKLGGPDYKTKLEAIKQAKLKALSAKLDESLKKGTELPKNTAVPQAKATAPKVEAPKPAPKVEAPKPAPKPTPKPATKPTFRMAADPTKPGAFSAVPEAEEAAAETAKRAAKKKGKGFLVRSASKLIGKKAAGYLVPGLGTALGALSAYEVGKMLLDPFAAWHDTPESRLFEERQNMGNTLRKAQTIGSAHPDPSEYGQIQEIRKAAAEGREPVGLPELPPVVPPAKLTLGGGRQKPPRMGGVTALPALSQMEPPLLNDPYTADEMQAGDLNRFTSLAGGKFGNWIGGGEPNPNPAYGIEPNAMPFNFYQDMIGEQGPPLPNTDEEDTSNAFDEYYRRWNEMPREEDYKPSIWRKLIGGLAGLSTGWEQGAGAGIETSRDFVRQPYMQAREKWQTSLDELEPLMKQQVYQDINMARIAEQARKTDLIHKSKTLDSEIERLKVMNTAEANERRAQIQEAALMAKAFIAQGQLDMAEMVLNETIRNHNLQHQDRVSGLGIQKQNADSLSEYRKNRTSSNMGALIEQMLREGGE